MSGGLMVALDMDDREGAVSIARSLGAGVSALKVGPQLFTRWGPEIVRRILAEGAGVFLDLKFHDIPNTVRKAVEGTAGMGLSWLTVHASGGREMVGAAKEAAGDVKVLAVTVLTSLSPENVDELGFRGPIRDQVIRLALMARGAGADGIVCSPLEVAFLREVLDENCIIVTPGIRPSGAAADDQHRISSPAAAVRAGADYLVVGRPVVGDPDPRAAAARILEEMKKALN